MAYKMYAEGKSVGNRLKRVENSKRKNVRHGVQNVRRGVQNVRQMYAKRGFGVHCVSWESQCFKHKTLEKLSN